jgi:hypothetical protein
MEFPGHVLDFRGYFIPFPLVGCGYGDQVLELGLVVGDASLEGSGRRKEGVEGKKREGRGREGRGESMGYGDQVFWSWALWLAMRA